mmetsp:Transcript_18287/g.45506  ORF Transcript_18287/g.45506 Transcript_18287/m.45506 type:complete len:488 (+) Transcript_18287:426-1889(+)
MCTISLRQCFILARWFGTPVSLCPLSDKKVLIFPSIQQHQRVPRAALLSRPHQRFQVPALRGVDAGPLVQRDTPLVQPTQNVHAPSLSRRRGGGVPPRAMVRRGVLKDVEVPFEGGTLPHLIAPRAASRYDPLEDVQVTALGGKRGCHLVPFVAVVAVEPRQHRHVSSTGGHRAIGLAVPREVDGVRKLKHLQVPAHGGVEGDALSNAGIHHTAVLLNPREHFQMPMKCRARARLAVPRAVALSHILEDVEPSNFGGFGARFSIPRASVFERPLQRLELAVARRRGTDFGAPRDYLTVALPLCTAPLQHLQMTSRGGCGARRLGVLASILAKPLQNLQVATRSGFLRGQTVPRAVPRPRRLENLQVPFFRRVSAQPVPFGTPLVQRVVQHRDAVAERLDSQRRTRPAHGAIQRVAEVGEDCLIQRVPWRVTFVGPRGAVAGRRVLHRVAEAVRDSGQQSQRQGVEPAQNLRLEDVREALTQQVEAGR